MSGLTAILEVDTPADLLARYYPNGKLGGLTVVGAAPGVLGEHVRLLVKVKKPGREFVVHGQLAWARYKSSRQLRACFGVDFLPTDEAVRLRVLAFARNEVGELATRIEQRVQVELPVRVIHGGQERQELVADLSPGGAFIRTWRPVALGEQVELVLRPRLTFRGVRMKGRVAWVRREGRHPGMGVEFIDDDGNARAEVDRILSKVTHS